MTKPVLLVTRKLPEAVEARATRDYDARLNLNDAHGARDGVEIVRRACEAGAAGVLCAPGDRFDSACINGLPPSVKVIATFSVGFDHIDTAAAKARGIVVTNTPGVLSFAVAECALTLMLMAARRAGEGDRLVLRGQVACAVSRRDAGEQEARYPWLRPDRAGTGRHGSSRLPHGNSLPQR